MENTALLSSKFPVLAGSHGPSLILGRRWPAYPTLRRVGGGRRQRFIASSRTSQNDTYKFARISSSKISEMSTASGTPPLPVPPPPSYIGSPLFWIGVGVGISALFSMVATKVKQYAMQQAFKTMMGQAAPQNSQFSNAAFPQGSPFPFPPTSASVSSTPSPSFSNIPSVTHVASQPAVTVDVSTTKVEATPPAEVKDEPATQKEEKKYAFIDVSPEEDTRKDSGYSVNTSTSSNVNSEKEATPNGVSAAQESHSSTDQSQSGKTPSVLSVEALEKMMEDPTVQKMVYPHLPEEMRNPTTFKWMIQNPEYRQQLQDMLNNMGGNGEWDSRMMDSLKNFDLSSPEVKQQFDQIGLTPEEVISKIMANPDVAMAFQNPKVQAAIMECSQNPLSITKYQNDKEVMDVFTKISELFPGMMG
ncbi:uncharacterized protein A4U43_C02F6090 [Asparagus officinalis]|uniref:Protein TIC 40, chloroplastic n=1 Tax=Asparagus officinalis TaxID=4686 RepID=A0A5P1FG92_ASPOF|nr:protein TIC 40, chloroplastic-like [Asparagus officinalis]ONK77395.1 uncharacterized protein A4U43_C02F6090 [Asparagus officinalis]